MKLALVYRRLLAYCSIFSCLYNHAEPIYICSAANKNCFGAVLQFIGSIHKTNYDQLAEIVLFDLGFTEEQRLMLARVAKLRIAQLLVPTPLQLHLYAWRPHAIKQALEQAPHTLWLDIDTLVLGPLEPIARYIAQEGYFLTVDGLRRETPLMSLASSFLQQEFCLDLPERAWIRLSPPVATEIQGVSSECTHAHLDPMCAVWYDMRFFLDENMLTGGDQVLLSGKSYTARMRVHVPDARGTILLAEEPISIAWRPEDITAQTTVYTGHADLSRISECLPHIRQLYTAVPTAGAPS